MICKAFRFDDMHGVAVIGFASPLPLKDLVVFLSPSPSPEGAEYKLRCFGLNIVLIEIIQHFVLMISNALH